MHLQQFRRRIKQLTRPREQASRESNLGFTPGLLPIACIAWCIGTDIGLGVDFDAGTWVLGAFPLAALSFIFRGRFLHLRGSTFLLSVAVVAFGMASQTIGTIDKDTAKVLSIADGRIVKVEGVVGSSPVIRESNLGALEHHGHVAGSITFVVNDWLMHHEGDRTIASECSLSISVTEHAGSLAVTEGDRISLRGRLIKNRSKRNPGERTSTPKAWVDIPNHQLIKLIPGDPTLTGLSAASIHSAWQETIRNALDSALSFHGSIRDRALVRAIILGVRDSSFQEMSIPYRRTGLAHYLAVSGFAFGVLIAIPGVLLTTQRPGIAGLIMVMVVIMGLCSIDIRAPALRAGIMSAVFFLGHALGRDWHRASLLALGCMIILLIDPLELGRPGFQLSFSVVASILVLSPELDRRISLLFDEHGEGAGACIAR
ncbi:MAG: ComEC family competence protein, partial [Phycisphaerales bacterium]|nr:ComEC family competence protein [Phycisphaerales bacterium]